MDEKAPILSSDLLRRYRMVLYGDEGIGKSTTALRLIQNKGLWLTADNTWSVGDTPEFRGKFDRIPWTLLSQIPDVVKTIKERNELSRKSVQTVADLNKLADLADGNSLQPYDLAILDPTSTALGDALDKFVDKYPLGGQRARNLPEYGHYYMVMREAKGLVEKLREVPCDVIYVCHSDDDKVPIRPNMNEKAAKAFYRECNLVAYMTREHGQERKIHLAPSNRIKAKTQIPALPEGVYSVDEFVQRLKEWKRG